MELSSFNIKNLLYFLKKKTFLIFLETETPPKILYISGNKTFLYFKQLFIFYEGNFQARKMKKPTQKKLLIFLEKLPKSENQIFYIFCLLGENVSNISAKEKSFLYFH